MATLLFDASAVVDIILGEGGTDVDISVVFDECLLDLTMYESANASWKVGVAHDRLTDSDLESVVDVLERLRNEVQIESVIGDELARTMQIARAEGLTFYDAAYLATAERENLLLVTEDGALRNAARARNVDSEGVSRIGV